MKISNNNIVNQADLRREFLNTIKDSDFDRFKEMLKAYPDLKDCKDPASGRPALLISVFNQQSNFFSHLLNCGADVNATINNNPIIFVLISSYDDEDEFYKFDYLKSFLKKKPNLELLHSNGNTPLITAVEGYEDDLVKLLIESGANPNTRNKQGDTPMHIAASNSNITYGNDTDITISIINLLIKAGADIYLQDINGFTALHTAVSNGNINSVELLIKRGANPITKNKQGDTPLLIAISNDDINMVKLLIQSGVNIDINDIEKSKSNKDIREFLKKTLDANEALLKAMAELNAESVKDALDKGAQIDVIAHKGTKATSLLVAAEKRHCEILKILIDKGANVNFQNSYGFTTLHYAVVKGPVEIVKKLIAAGADVNTKASEGITALHYALKYGQLEILKILIANKADVNLLNPDNGVTTLHFAAASCTLEIVKELVVAGADIKSTDNKGRDALDAGKCNSNEDIYKFLKKTHDLNKALLIDLKQGNIEKVKNLIESGAQTKILHNFQKEYPDKSILHLAIEKNDFKSVHFFIKNGCDINQKNTLGQKPYEFAKDLDLIGMESFLKLAYIEMEIFLNLDDAEIKILFNWSLDNLTDINASKVHYDQEVKTGGDDVQKNYGELE